MSAENGANKIKVMGYGPNGLPTRSHLIYAHGIVGPVGLDAIESAVAEGRFPAAVLNDPSGVILHSTLHADGQAAGLPLHTHSRDRKKVS